MNKIVNLIVGILILVLSGICTYLLAENNAQHSILHRRISEESKINDEQGKKLIKLETIMEMRGTNG